jgi:hypothetical protein
MMARQIGVGPIEAQRKLEAPTPFAPFMGHPLEGEAYRELQRARKAIGVNLLQRSEITRAGVGHQMADPDSRN